MRVTVTGGAGYIGSQTARQLVDAGHEVVVFDDLSSGHLAAVPDGVRTVRGSLRGSLPGSLRQSSSDADTTALRDALDGADAVMHFAASIEAGESVTDPARFWHNNLAGTVALLDAMRVSGVGRLVFSSTAAVYGNPTVDVIDEATPTAPTNPYGQTKLACEMVIADYARAYDLDTVCLRYFNAAGADPGGAHGPDHHHKTHLITLCLEAAAGAVDELAVFGTDYATPDGTAVRDYVHVADLADAHLCALDALAGGMHRGTYNLGNGAGHTVRDVVACAKEVTGVDFAVVDRPRRAGDPARLVASSAAAERDLGWSPRRGDLAVILADAWRWRSGHPLGYGDR
jgi:UDP-glucose 4-epimerase